MGPLLQDAKIAKCCLVYKRIKNNVPAYIEDSLKFNSNQHTRTTMQIQVQSWDWRRKDLCSYYLQTMELFKIRSRKLCVIK
jgi:hypothetical protein